MSQMLSLVSYVQPELKSTIASMKQQPSNLLKELTSLNAGGLARYEELVERVCDDLIENVNNQIDLYKKEKDGTSSIPVKTEIF